MILILTALLAVLVIPHQLEAVPFTPDWAEAEVLDASFVLTGTNSACVFCDDANPNNDFNVQMFFEGASAGWAVDGPSGFLGGLLTFDGTTLTTFDAIHLDMELHVVVRVQETLIPEEIAEYPLPSVQTGMLTGFIAGLGGTFMVLECCLGVIHGAFFDMESSNFPNLFEPSRGSKQSIIQAVGPFGPQPYTPELTPIPEPTSLLLFGSGVLGLVARLRRQRSLT